MTSTTQTKPGPTAWAGANALAARVAQDSRNPFPALEAGLAAWSSILQRGRSHATSEQWAAVGRACVLFADCPSSALEHRLTFAGFVGITTPDHDAAQSAFTAQYAPPADTDPADLATEDDRLLWLSRFDGDTMLAAVLRLKPTTPREQWWRLLGMHWVMFDIEQAREAQMAGLIRKARPADRRAMMTPLERGHLAQLPEVLTVYRGCYQCERGGLSWSLSPAIAAKFPFLERYKRPGDTPLLLTAKVQRDDCVLLLSRGELEVIATDPSEVITTDLTGYAPCAAPWVYVVGH